MTTLMRSGSKPSIRKTRDVPREYRARAFDWDPISGLHQGQQPERLHSKPEYMMQGESDVQRSVRAQPHHVNSRQRGTSVAFEAKRTLTAPRLRYAIYEYTP
jgi:hypothetical protein